MSIEPCTHIVLKCIHHAKGIQEHHKNQEYGRDHTLTKQACNRGCKVEKKRKKKNLSFGWVLDIMKWFKGWGVKELLELWG